MTRSMRIVVIGGGLAGLSAAIEASSALQEDRSEGADAEIVIVEKEERLGGNSMKASSGISALAVDNGDSLEKYVDDTLASGGGDSDNDLVNVLAVCGISQHGDRVEGVTLCQHGEEREVRADCVIIATGGFGYSSELLQEYAPKAAAYGTTNGPWATGDGMVLGKQAGGLLKHMDKVQVHPTGIVNPQDPAQRNKWLAPERLRGCGGFLVSREGHRFVDELQRRDTVVDAVCRQQGETAFLVVSSAAAARYGEGALKFYAMKGMAHCADNLERAAEWIGCSTAALAASVDNYNAAASGARADALGRAHFATGPVDVQAPMYVLQVAPVTHYCMGGLAIDSTAQVVGAGGVPIKGLLAAGEVTGGVHGRNRLAGNSLLDCVVFGRIAGATAARIALSNAQAA